jgi:hypothetical protein
MNEQMKEGEKKGRKIKSKGGRIKDRQKRLVT